MSKYRQQQIATRVKRIAKFRKLVAQGMSFAEIGRIQNPPISRERVRQLLKETK